MHPNKNKLKPWQRDAPVIEVKSKPKPGAWSWATPQASKVFDPLTTNDDGTNIPRDYRCTEKPDAGLMRLLGKE